MLRARPSVGAEYRPHAILFDADGELAVGSKVAGTEADWERLGARLSSG